MLKDDHKILILLVGLVIIRGIIYISIVPPWLAPDEPAHFEAIRLIGQVGLRPTKDVYLTTPMHPEMPSSFEKFHIWKIGGIAPPPTDNPLNAFFIYYYPPSSTGGLVTAGSYPLLYHSLLAPVSALIKAWHITEQLYLLRFISLLFTVFIVMIGWYFTRAIFPEAKMYAVTVTSFLVFLPMHIHVNTSLNTDVVTTLLASLYFLVLVKIFRDGVSPTKVVLAGGLQIAAILVKPTVLFTIPTSVVAAMVYFARRFQWKPKVLALLLVTMVVFALPGAVLFFQVANTGRVSTMSFSASSINLRGEYFSPDSLAIYIHSIRWGFLSFWGYFGWNNIPIPGFWARVLWIICLPIGIGAAIFLGRALINLKSKSVVLRPYQRDILLVLLLSSIFALISIYTPIVATQSTEWGPPSRYLFPALLPLTLYLFLGFQQLIPARLYHLTLPVWLTGLIFFDSLVLANVLIPSIYG